MFFRKSIAGITKQFTTMVADLQKLAEQNRVEAGFINTNADELETAAQVKYQRELAKVDGLYAEAADLTQEANAADKLAAKIAKTFSL